MKRVRENLLRKLAPVSLSYFDIFVAAFNSTDLRSWCVRNQRDVSDRSNRRRYQRTLEVLEPI